MSTVTGVVQAMSSRKLQRGSVYSIKVNEQWYGGMFDHPGVDKGDTVTFTAEQSGQYMNVAKGSLKKVEGTPTPAATPPSQGAPASAGGTNWEQKDMRITFLASRKDAIELLAVALQHGAVTLPKAENKRLAALEAIVDELSAGFFEKAWNFDGKGEFTPASDAEAE